MGALINAMRLQNRKTKNETSKDCINDVYGSSYSFFS